MPNERRSRDTSLLHTDADRLAEASLAAQEKRKIGSPDDLERIASAEIEVGHVMDLDGVLAWLDDNHVAESFFQALQYPYKIGTKSHGVPGLRQSVPYNSSFHLEAQMRVNNAGPDEEACIEIKGGRFTHTASPVFNYEYNLVLPIKYSHEKERRVVSHPENQHAGLHARYKVFSPIDKEVRQGVFPGPVPTGFDAVPAVFLQVTQEAAIDMRYLLVRMESRAKAAEQIGGEVAKLVSNSNIDI